MYPNPLTTRPFYFLPPGGRNNVNRTPCSTNPLSRNHSSLLPHGVEDANLTPYSTNPSPRNHLGNKLPSMWREVQGCNDWQHLVHPLDPLLRDEIIRYGEFAVACYKVFELDPCSSRFFNCKYGKKSMFDSIGMNNTGYRITKYIYATPDIAIPLKPDASQSRWVGYVAVASNSEVDKLGRRDILIAFRGTVTGTEWIANFMNSLTQARFDPNDPRPDVMVESGFLSMYTCDDSTSKFSQGSCREQLLGEISRIINEYKGDNMSITMVGHSMGSCLSLLLAYDIAELRLNRDTKSNKDIPIAVFKFASPRVGNVGFQKRCEELGVKVLRVANVNDPVTKVPGVILNEGLRVFLGKYEMPWSHSCYVHVGVELALDFLRMENPACVHDLDAYIESLKNGAPQIAGSERWQVNFSWDDAPRLMGKLLSPLGLWSALSVKI